MRSSARNPRGFTLLELVIVMLVVTTILALAAPQMRGFLAGTRSRDAATQLVALAGYAKARSASEARVYRLNVGTDSYSLSVEDGQAFRPVATDFGKEFSIPDTLHVEIVPLPSAAMNSQLATRVHAAGSPGRARADRRGAAGSHEGHLAVDGGGGRRAQARAGGLAGGNETFGTHVLGDVDANRRHGRRLRRRFSGIPLGSVVAG